MNITNQDFRTFINMADILTKYEDSLTEYEQEVLHEGQCVIDELWQKRAKDNLRKAKQIAERRKIDPTYGGADWYRKKKGV